MKSFFQKAIIVFVGILFVSCNHNSGSAKLYAKNCLIEPVEEAFYVSNIILFSNNPTINEKNIHISDSSSSSSKINLCSVLESNKIVIADVNLISVLMKSIKNDTQQFIINSDQLSLIGEDTVILLKQSVE